MPKKRKRATAAVPTAHASRRRRADAVPATSAPPRRQPTQNQRLRSMTPASPRSKPCSRGRRGDGYARSREAKRKQREKSVFLDGIQYGEVSISSFAAAVELTVRPQPVGETFVDVGSGVGKAVLAAVAAAPAGGCDRHRDPRRFARRGRGSCGSRPRGGRVRRADDARRAPRRAAARRRCNSHRRWRGRMTATSSSARRHASRPRCAPSSCAAPRRLRVGARVIVTTAALASARFRLLRSEAPRSTARARRSSSRTAIGRRQGCVESNFRALNKRTAACAESCAALLH